MLAICPVFCPEACARPPARKQLMHIHDVPEVGLLYSVPCRMACSDVFRAVRELAFPRTGITCELLSCPMITPPWDCELWCLFGAAHVR